MPSICVRASTPVLFNSLKFAQFVSGESTGVPGNRISHENEDSICQYCECDGQIRFLDVVSRSFRPFFLELSFSLPLDVHHLFPLQGPIWRGLRGRARHDRSGRLLRHISARIDQSKQRFRHVLSDSLVSPPLSLRRCLLFFLVFPRGIRYARNRTGDDDRPGDGDCGVVRPYRSQFNTRKKDVSGATTALLSLLIQLFLSS